MQARIQLHNLLFTMNNNNSTPAAESMARTLAAGSDAIAQSYIYSFRCSRGMDECLSRLMGRHGLNRTSVIRLALYALDSLSRRHEANGLALQEFMELLEGLAPEARLSFSDFLRGS